MYITFIRCRAGGNIVWSVKYASMGCNIGCFCRQHPMIGGPNTFERLSATLTEVARRDDGRPCKVTPGAYSVASYELMPVESDRLGHMINRDRFRAEAVACLRQEIPEDLEWLPWGDLPPMRWADDGSPVDELIPRGWLVAAARQGRPRPDAGLRRRAALFDRDAAAVLGAWLLRAWIEHDTATPMLDAARKAELRTIAERGAELARRFGRGGTDPEQRYRQLLAQEDGRPAPSALPHQGLLAVVAACGDGAVAAEVERYVESRHQQRPEQCRALLRMLSWMNAPAAAELLSAARRFPGLRATAAELIAERAGRD